MPKAKADKQVRLLDENSVPATSSSGAGGDAVARVQAQVDTVTNTMRDNVTVMMDNIERTSQLETNTANLASQARSFHTTSRQTRK